MPIFTNANCGEKKKIESEAKREGQSGFRKQDIVVVFLFFVFFFCLKVQMIKIYIPVALFQI